MADRPTTDDPQISERLEHYLADCDPAWRSGRIVPLTGDASDRKYFRIIPAGGSSVVLAVHPGPIEFASLPFANVSTLMQAIPLPSPTILDHSDPLGIMALQDLGDLTLQAHLGATSPEERAALYRQSVAYIELLQRRGAELASDRYVPYGIAFDVEKLTWELNFFTKHFLEAYRGIQLSDADRVALSEEWRIIAAELAAEPRVLCHRDYHSRNLMLHDGTLYVIDFQDARMGPDTYDLVSLLRDSYVDISDRALDDLIAYFLALTSHTPGAQDPQTFRRRFDLMSLQRNLKALGTFAYQTTTRRNPVYLQYMPRTLRAVRTNLHRYPRFARLRDLLAGHVDELR